MRRPVHPQAGFTLLELLVVAVLLGLLFLALQEGVRFGLVALHSQQRATQGLETHLAVDRVVRRLIGGLDAGARGRARAVTGGVHRLAFRSDLQFSAVPVPPADMVLAVRSGALVLSWRPYLHAVGASGPGGWHREVLRGGVRRVVFAYWSRRRGQWLSTWTAEAPPDLIRLHMDLTREGETWPDMIVEPMRDRAD